MYDKESMFSISKTYYRHKINKQTSENLGTWFSNKNKYQIFVEKRKKKLKIEAKKNTIRMEAVWVKVVGDRRHPKMVLNKWVKFGSDCDNRGGDFWKIIILN